MGFPLVLVAALAGCSGGTTPAVIDTLASPPRLEIAVNGVVPGPVANAFCGVGVLVAPRLINSGGAPLFVERLTVAFEPLETSVPCLAHDSGIDPESGIRVAPGTTALLRSFDASGTLCRPPNGRPNCAFSARVVATTDQGVLSASQIIHARESTAAVLARIDAPSEGAVLSGVARIFASTAPGCGCADASSYVWLFSASGRLVEGAGPLRFEPWELPTQRYPNGVYDLRASQACCGGLGPAVRVTLRN